jgi:hypothetical protein
MPFVLPANQPAALLDQPTDLQLMYYKTRCKDLTEILTSWENDS